MPLVNRIRPRIGDIIEFATNKGLAYAQYTHYHRDPPVFGELLRILPGFYKTRPDDFTEIVQLPERFWQFLPLGAACNRRYVKIVANEAIPEYAKKFPTFREGTIMPGGVYSPEHWSLWDGKKTISLKKLLPEHFHLSMLNVCGVDFLVERIESGYKPEDEIELH